MLSNISLSQYLTGKLRAAVVSGALIDYNSANRGSQFGQFIYPDVPMLSKLMKSKSNFPRISIESVSQSSDHRMGQQSSSYLMKETVKITCYSVRDLICNISTTSGESILYDPLVDVYELDNLPFSNISMVTGLFSGIMHTFVNGTDYEKYDSDGDGFFDSIKWLGVDEPDGTFSVNYNRKGTGAEVVRVMAQNINEFFRKNWRINFPEHKIFNYRLLSFNPIDFEEESGLYRFELTVQFSSFDGMESV